MNGVICGSIRQGKWRPEGIQAAFKTSISLHFDSFEFISVRRIPLRIQYNNENDHPILTNIKFSERFEFDNPCPECQLNEKNRKNELFSLFFIFFVQKVPPTGYYYIWG